MRVVTLGAIGPRVHVHVPASIHACAHNCSRLSVIIHFNGRKLGEKCITLPGPPCKSQINMECKVFMLQLTAGRSIPKMHQDPERGFLQLQFIIIPLDSIEKHLCRSRKWCSTCRLIPSSGQTVNAVRPSMRKASVPSTLLILLLKGVRGCGSAD